MIFIRELRVWNSARTIDELLYYSNKPMFKGTFNLISYYKLIETDYAIFDSIKSSWSYDEDP